MNPIAYVLAFIKDFPQTKNITPYGIIARAYYSHLAITGQD